MRAYESGKTLSHWQDKATQINEANGWTIPPFADADGMLAKLMLVVTEVAEAAEDVRKGNRLHFGEELADTVIRVMHIADSEGIDLEREIAHKLEVNKMRGYKHGGKRA